MEKLKLETLAAYVKAKRGRLTDLAKGLGVSDSYLSQMISGERPMDPTYCVAIEKLTKGKVPRASCRPLDGHVIWSKPVRAPRASMTSEASA